MPVTSSLSKVSYDGNGASTIFDYSFKIWAAADLVVVVTDAAGTDSTKVLDTDYSVSGAGSDAGGTVTYPLTGSPLATGEKITLRRVLPITQTADIENQGGFYPEVHEEVFDRHTMVDQQQQDALDRAPKAPFTDPPLDMTLPPVATRATKLLGFDAAGAPVVSISTVGQMDSVVSGALSAGAAVGTVPFFSTLGDLRALTSPPALVVRLLGRVTAHDGGFSEYRYDGTGDPEDDNDFTVIVDAGGGLWRYVPFMGIGYNAIAAGVVLEGVPGEGAVSVDGVGDHSGTDDTPAWQRWVDQAPDGSWLFVGRSGTSFCDYLKGTAGQADQYMQDTFNINPDQVDQLIIKVHGRKNLLIDGCSTLMLSNRGYIFHECQSENIRYVNWRHDMPASRYNGVMFNADDIRTRPDNYEPSLILSCYSVGTTIERCRTRGSYRGMRLERNARSRVNRCDVDDVRYMGFANYAGFRTTAGSTTGVAASFTATAGGAATVTLPAGASDTDDAYNGMICWIKSGTGAGGWKTVTDYDGTTRVATMSGNWATPPDGTSVVNFGLPFNPSTFFSVPYVDRAVDGHVEYLTHFHDCTANRIGLTGFYSNGSCIRTNCSAEGVSDPYVMNWRIADPSDPVAGIPLALGCHGFTSRSGKVNDTACVAVCHDANWLLGIDDPQEPNRAAAFSYSAEDLAPGIVTDNQNIGCRATGPWCYSMLVTEAGRLTVRGFNCHRYTMAGMLFLARNLVSHIYGVTVEATIGSVHPNTLRTDGAEAIEGFVRGGVRVISTSAGALCTGLHFDIKLQQNLSAIIDDTIRMHHRQRGFGLQPRDGDRIAHYEVADLDNDSGHVYTPNNAAGTTLVQAPGLPVKLTTDTDGFAAGVTGATFTLTATAPPDALPHRVGIRNNSANDHSGKTITLVGTDIDGEATTDVVTGPAGSKTVYSSKAFKTLTSATPSATIGADTFDIGWIGTVPVRPGRIIRAYVDEAFDTLNFLPEISQLGQQITVTNRGVAEALVYTGGVSRYISKSVAGSDYNEVSLDNSLGTDRAAVTLVATTVSYAPPSYTMEVADFSGTWSLQAHVP